MKLALQNDGLAVVAYMDDAEALDFQDYLQRNKLRTWARRHALASGARELVLTTDKGKPLASWTLDPEELEGHAHGFLREVQDAVLPSMSERVDYALERAA